MNLKYPIPLTHGEAIKNKPANIVRLATRIAIVKIENNDRRILLIKHPAKGIELPGGAVEANELPETAALRQLKEETGVSFIKQLVLLLSEMITVVDIRGGNWLDIIYCCIVDDANLNCSDNAEFDARWLSTANIGGIVPDKTIDIVNKLT